MLSTVHGEITLEVLYVAPDDSSDDEDSWEEDEGQRLVITLTAYIVFRGRVTEVIK